MIGGDVGRSLLSRKPGWAQGRGLVRWMNTATITFKTDGTFIIVPFPFFRFSIISLPTEYQTAAP